MSDPAPVVYLTLEDLLELVADLQVGPVRDVGLLDAAAHRPRASVFGRDAYPELDQKAAALLESIVRGHALVDGNKRLGWLATVVFYGLNGVDFEVPDDEAYDVVVGVAEGRMTMNDISLALSRWRPPRSV